MPPRFKTEPRNLFAHENADVEFECDVYGVPTPTIKWMKDGDPLIPSDYFQVVIKVHRFCIIRSACFIKNVSQISTIHVFGAFISDC